MANLEFERPRTPSTGLGQWLRKLLWRQEAPAPARTIRWLGPHTANLVTEATSQGEAVRLIFGNEQGTEMCRFFGHEQQTFGEGDALNAMFRFASFVVVLKAVREGCSARGMVHQDDGTEYAVDLVPDRAH